MVTNQFQISISKTELPLWPAVQASRPDQSCICRGALTSSNVYFVTPCAIREAFPKRVQCPLLPYASWEKLSVIYDAFLHCFQSFKKKPHTLYSVNVWSFTFDSFVVMLKFPLQITPPSAFREKRLTQFHRSWPQFNPAISRTKKTFLRFLLCFIFGPGRFKQKDLCIPIFKVI